MSTKTETTPRDVCTRCWRPVTACYCAHVSPIETKTHLVLLQHPRERECAIGTARMAHLSLPRSELLVGIDWSASRELDQALSKRPAILLYPGKDAIDIAKHPPKEPVTLVVIDGTWAQARKVMNSNPRLQALPRYAFVPETPSDYRIRKEPNAASVATIEALFHALRALEGDRFGALLEPFRKMVDFQIECQKRSHAEGRQTRHAERRARLRRMSVPRVITDRFDDLVCIAAEANSWPYVMRNDPRYADELVHWAAYRPATGDTLSMVIAPRGELAESTAAYVGLDEGTIRSGCSFAELERAFASFTRPSDVLCSWGQFAPRLFESCGGTLLSFSRLDLRHVARDLAKGVSPTLEPNLPGRAGRKIRALAGVLDMFLRRADSAGLRPLSPTSAPRYEAATEPPLR